MISRLPSAYFPLKKESAMQFTNIYFSYGDKEIFRGLSLTLPNSGIAALCGPSGCGKTTLLRLLCGLEKPRSGTVDAPPPQDIAVLFQENRLLPKLTVSQQISAVLPKGTPVDKWLAAVQLTQDADTPAEELSGGMSRRTALARCLAYGTDKSLLVLDEPFTGVDAAKIDSIAEFIRTMGVPTVLTAHDERTIAIADTVVQLDKR